MRRRGAKLLSYRKNGGKKRDKSQSQDGQIIARGEQERKRKWNHTKKKTG